MSEKNPDFFEKLHIVNTDRHHFRQIATSLSLAVVLVVFWSLKLTGIGVAGEAFCGKAEHKHSEACVDCQLEEHIHDETCYSNITADLESTADWDNLFKDIANGPTVKENVVLVAQSQLGCKESSLNFQVDEQGVRRGITRYGQWYGNPYGDWSAMFASFCLHYGGAKNAPANAGPEAMRLEWEFAGLYETAAQGSPEAGNLIFLHKGGDEGETANSVAIIEEVNTAGISVLEGDVNDTVVRIRYAADDPVILGYGLVPSPSAIVTVQSAPSGAANQTIWLDGTDGGLGHLTGSPNTSHTIKQGAVIRLPAEWTSPSKYSYKLRGWYDISNSQYYPAGGEMTVTGNTVLYADWVARTYDIGQFNAQVADTVSTNSFITTHMFDYNYLFNVQSANPKVTVSSSSHSETWSMLGTGTVNYGGAPTLNYIFAESDSGGRLANPSGRTPRNSYQSATTISSGILTPEMRELLYSTENGFDPHTGAGIIGKTYLGTGDHLFQIIDDPNDEHYGYYYYDSLRNAISFNQRNQRFYVYEYLGATSDAIGSSYADFLPLNSPYANTNGKTPGTYSYNGHYDEYRGITHYRYDTKYDSGSNNTPNTVYTEFAYGMRTDINFYLPNDPGTGGNKDLRGNDIVFEFSGDDDLWVLIDDIVVLDIGGIHQRIAGEINFSTGEVSVNNRAAPSLQDLGIDSGDYTLTVLYLERGASMSNCSIYFNVIPRFGLEIQKEDALTQELLDGTQFTIYEDFACTKPAELWESEQAYNEDHKDDVLNDFQSTFTVTNGVAKVWGFGAGNTYYIKETGPPGKAGYALAKGVIELTVDKGGLTTYHVAIIPDAEGNEPSKGFTVHGVRIDETTQTVYMVVTNAPEAVKEVTTVQVYKKWGDSKDHSSDYIQAYLTVKEADGTVRRIREITLSDENEWMYTWTNLPKHDYDTQEEVVYGIEESYESGYYSTVRQVTEISTEKIIWAEAAQIFDDESYLLKHATNGYLSTTSETDAKLKWVNEATAKESPLAMWTISIASGSGDSSFTATFINGAGQRLTFNSSNSSSNRYFHAVKGSASNQTLNVSLMTNGLRIHGIRNNRNYYMSSLNTSTGRISTTTSTSSVLYLKPIKKLVESETHEVNGWAYEIINTPLEEKNETSVTVTKEWMVPVGFDHSSYQEFHITVKLLANGIESGRTVTLNLKNNWKGVFQGLPYKSESGEVIKYSVVENWEAERWIVKYGEMTASGEDPPTYSVVITNTYIPGGPMLPSTGTSARLMYTLCGWSIILGALVYGITLRRKRERRTK